jgi:hypothetical protein
MTLREAIKALRAAHPEPDSVVLSDGGRDWSLDCLDGAEDEFWSQDQDGLTAPDYALGRYSDGRIYIAIIGGDGQVQNSPAAYAEVSSIAEGR